MLTGKVISQEDLLCTKYKESLKEKSLENLYYDKTRFSKCVRDIKQNNFQDRLPGKLLKICNNEILSRSKKITNLDLIFLAQQGQN